MMLRNLPQAHHKVMRRHAQRCTKKMLRDALRMREDQLTCAIAGEARQAAWLEIGWIPVKESFTNGHSTMTMTLKV